MDVAGVLRGVCGVQAQLPRAAALALRARGGELTLEDVVRARGVERSAVRAWFMRGSIHLVAADDAGWLLSALGPVFVASGRRRLAQLGFDEDATIKGVRDVGEALAESGPLTRAEILARLGMDPDGGRGYASTHLLRRAALEGVVCFGPDRHGEETYALSSDWGVPAYRGDREPALAELARRHLAAYGPARPEDLAAWSGLTMREARAAWKLVDARLDEVRLADGPAWVLSGGAVAEVEFSAGHDALVRLLPHLDAYLLGYRNRGFAVAPPHARRVLRGGFLRPVAIQAGKAVATWEYRKAKRPEVVVEPFEGLAPATEAGLEAETEDLGRFLGAAPPALTLKAPG